ncbi:MAG: hypothetical protein HZC38_12545 [Chloroflexi bacterium]|nr:hypothetical protein [Chloroflexota bacterium]MBI5082068.1 hypothetical protein [Chloroflexota bacterium]MBI5714233.1 hypothetical protein [Chloroflexota bacterium]
MAHLTSSQFMLALPSATREHLPPELKKFKTATRSWLCQLYYRDSRLHYEVWNMGERRGLLEIGLHFESKDRNENVFLLNHFSRYMIEVKSHLGSQWEAEMWDKGWAKVYETIPYQPFADDVLEDVSKRLARAMTVLHPIWSLK